MSSSIYPTLAITEFAELSTGRTNAEDAVESGAYPLFDRSQILKASDRFLFDCEAIIVPGEGKDFVPRYYSGKFDLHQRCYAIRPKAGVDAKFVYYAVRAGRDHLAQVAVGSTVRSLRRSSFETMQIPMPELEDQQNISATLSALDYKIELNNQINHHLVA